ncbi:MAG TPA: hypothetical protein VF710_17620 [Longimicrobium sp.]|jgi:hypothetical protein
MKAILTLAALLSLALPASAQRRETALATATPVVFADSTTATRPSPAARIASRGGSAFLGMGLLAVAGGYTGYQLTYRTAGGEDPGLDGMLVGAVVGGSLGAALGAALPEHGGRCDRRGRFLRGLLGTAATSAAFLAVQQNGAAEVLVAFPIATPLVAAIAADC